MPPTSQSFVYRRVWLLGCAVLCANTASWKDSESDDSGPPVDTEISELPLFQSLSVTDDAAWDELPVFQVTAARPQ
jgi:hypothetical protein